MINFNIEDVQNILRKCNVNDLVVHPHILDNWFERSTIKLSVFSDF